MSSSKKLNTGDAHPVFVLGAAALIKTGEVCNREVMWAARKVHQGAVIGGRASAAVVSVGRRGVRHSSMAAGKTLRGSLVIARKAVVVTRHALGHAASASFAVARRTGKMAGMAVRAGVRKARRSVGATLYKGKVFTTTVAIPAAARAVGSASALVVRVSTQSALAVGSACAFAALNARQLSAAAVVMAKDACSSILLVFHEGCCVVFQLGQRTVQTARVCTSAAGQGVVAVAAAGKSAVVHTYRTPRYLMQVTSDK